MASLAEFDQLSELHMLHDPGSHGIGLNWTAIIPGISLGKQE
jgi:hypothetical protein